jgi:hypothetical protein
VVVFGWRANHVNCLISLCLQNLHFLNFNMGGGCSSAALPPHLFHWVHLWTTLSHLQKLFTRWQCIPHREQSLSQLWGPIMVRDNESLGHHKTCMSFLSILITTGIYGPVSLKIANIRFHEHSSGRSHYAPCRQAWWS